MKKQLGTLNRLAITLAAMAAASFTGVDIRAQSISDFRAGYPPAPVEGQWQSERVFYTDGRLTYPSDAEQNRIPDFSYAGYHYGEKDLPSLPVVATLGPESGDNTERIQAALDAVGARPPDANGHRGALLLLPGQYDVQGVLRIRHNGVVLRGSGNGTDPAADTILFARGNTPNRRTVVTLGSGSGNPWRAGMEVNITDDFVQVGSLSFNVEDPAPFSAGQHVVVRHPSSREWIAAVDGGGMTRGADWSPGSIDMRWIRRITQIEGKQITLDAPIYNHLDKSLTQSTIAPVTSRNLVSESGIETLRIDIETEGGNDQRHAWNCIGVTGADNCWVRNVNMRYFGYAGVRLNGAIRITVKDCRATDPVAVRTGGNMYNFSADAYSQLILITGCHAGQGRHSFVSNGTSTVSGIVVHRCTMEGGDFEAHRRWSQGLLLDNLRETGNANSQAKLINRGDFGTSHGWGGAHSVIWGFNKQIIVQKPPTAQNYAVSNTGELRPRAWFPGEWGSLELKPGPLSPESLYEAQLAERLAAGGSPAILRQLEPETTPVNE